jgi:thiol:disulfide interchange protein DsbD
MIDTLENERSVAEGTPATKSNPLARLILVALLAGGAVAGWKYLEPKNALAQAGWIYDWDAAVEQSRRTGKPALVLFTADWCGPCQTFKSRVLCAADVQTYLRANHTLVVVDVTSRTGASARRAADFNVRAIPALILYDESGRELARGGGMPADALLAWLRSGGRSVR